ncbi:hypothetical protein GYMLUDRAFT_758129 [Collybiopsis luxurians FD-317 M1]|uniref:DUF6697 domain-containing protein n=1 Tax=Collybiopsis luxurians FD-317 M1 TaxID=944289 RepID=A0A0D0C4R5_9AGAR|nr:hypothetical protein GYMLUDRAFT_758129 [Collybiopsis luxurians FD-317 M1]
MECELIVLFFTQFHTYWTNAIQKIWGRYVRVQIHLRKTLGQEPTPKQIQEEDNDCKHITVEEVKDAFDTGKQRLDILVLQCVGYDEGLQKELVEKSLTWIKLQGKGPKEKRGGKGKVDNTERKKTATRSKGNRKVVGPINEIEEQEESEWSEVMLTAGTKSRPERK